MHGSVSVVYNAIATRLLVLREEYGLDSNGVQLKYILILGNALIFHTLS